MAIEIANKTKERINRPLIERAILGVLRFGKRRGDVSVVIVSDAAMKKLNYSLRGKNKPTDVLSFAESDSESAEPSFIGELVIDMAQIKRQAKQFKHSISWELAFIVIHGCLHLIGYEDETESGRKKMEKLGYMIIEKII